MNLKDAIKLAKKNRPSWRNGSGATTVDINLKHVLHVLGKTYDCNKVNVGAFIRLQRSLATGDSATGRKLGPSTINKVTSALHTVLTELNYAGKLAVVPNFRRLEEPEPRSRFYEKSELEQLQAAAQAIGDDLMAKTLLFAYKTGCRQGEVLKLEVRDVNFDANEVTFRETKNGKDHVLPLNPELTALLQGLCAGLGPNEKVFPFTNKDNLYNRFLKARKEAGLGTDCLFHTIRHTTGTHLAEAGAPLRSIMGVLNHSSTATTLRYAKTTDKAKEEALNLL